MATGKQETPVATPVALLWEKVLMLPIVGTVDSKRAHEIMEILLAKVQETESKVIILDILGVPTVDSKVAALLVKIIQACKLMGADVIVSGMSPRIAQTLVNLDDEMTHVITAAPLKDAIKLALDMNGWEVVTKKKPASK
jgi:rsbT co-antagonist protein RsbR